MAPQLSSKSKTIFQLRWVSLLIAAAIAVSQSGCRPDIRKWFGLQPAPPPCVLSENPTRDELIQLVNQRSSKLQAWRSNDVQIQTRAPGSMPMKLSAVMAVENPRRFRLIAKFLTGYEADFGSNDDRFWFWMRRADPKYIYYADHKDLGMVQRRLPIPFRPDWIVGALLVSPLNPDSVTLVPTDARSGRFLLTVDELSPAGRPVRRNIWIDRCYGHIVKQDLQDTNGRTIASAEFREFEMDTASGLELPHRIDLHWPEQKMTMILSIGGLQVNPVEFPEKTWQFPEYDGFPRFNLARDTLGSFPRERQARRRRVPPQPVQSRRAQNRDNLPARGRQIRPDFAEDRFNAATTRNQTAPAGSDAGRVRVAAEPQPFPGTQAQRPSFRYD